MPTTLLPGAYSQFVPSGGAPNPAIPDIIACLVGKSLGKPTRVENEAVVRGGSINTADALSKTGILSIVSVSNTNGGPSDYQLTRDFIMGSGADLDKIQWSPTAKLAPPTMDTPSKLLLTGTFSGTGPHYYVITATHGAGQETLQSNTVQITLALTTDRVQLSWSRVVNATGYKIFRSTSTTFGATTLLTTIASGDTTSYIDTGSAVGAGTPAVSNSTENEPIAAATYYVTYEYADVAAAYGVLKRYTQLSDVYADHGANSELAIMAEFAMSALGTGNEGPAIYAVGTNGLSASYQSGIVALEAIRNEIPLIVCGLSNDAVNQSLRDHVFLMNTLEKKRERAAILWSASGAAIGTNATVGTLLYELKQSSDHNAAPLLFHVVPDSGSAKGAVRQANGSYLDQTVAHQYLAAGLAGMVSAFGDPAVPWTRKVYQGLSTMGGAEYTDTQLTTLRDAGAVVIDNEGGVTWRILEGVTTKTNGTLEDKISSISLAKLSVLMLWRQFIDPPATFSGAQGSLIGNKLNDGLLEQVKTRTMIALDFLLARAMISGYDKNSIQATQDATDKTRVNVQFSYLPVYPSDRIVANVSFQAAA